MMNWATTPATLDVGDITKCEWNGFGFGNFEARAQVREDVVVKFTTAKMLMQFWSRELKTLRSGGTRNVLGRKRWAVNGR